MLLSAIDQSDIPGGVPPIEWGDLPRRFLNAGELEVLVALVKRVEPRVMIEFGVNAGRTAKAMLRNVPTISRYIGIDVTPDYVPSKVIQRREVPANPGELARDDMRFELLIKPRGSLDLKARDLPRCDVAFIDGDHGREAVLHDTMLAEKRVRPGGMIIWHDYHDLGTVDVRDVLDERHRAGAELYHVAGTWIAYQPVRKDRRA